MGRMLASTSFEDIPIACCNAAEYWVYRVHIRDPSITACVDYYMLVVESAFNVYSVPRPNPFVRSTRTYRTCLIRTQWTTSRRGDVILSYMYMSILHTHR